MTDPAEPFLNLDKMLCASISHLHQASEDLRRAVVERQLWVKISRSNLPNERRRLSVEAVQTLVSQDAKRLHSLEFGPGAGSCFVV